MISNVFQTIDEELPRMEGWCSPTKGRRMAELTYRTHLCVELGVFGGRSLVSMALALKDQGYGLAIGVDPYTKDAALEGSNDPANDAWWASVDLEEILRGAKQHIERLGLFPYARIDRCRSQDIAGQFQGRIIDLLHQDGNHSQEISCQEVEAWAPKLRQGGYWVFDDAGWPTLARAQLLLAERGFSLLEEHEETGSRWRVYVSP